MKGLSNQVSLFVHQDEEEGFVLDDRTAEAASKLIPVLVVLGDAIEIVKPIAGVERRVSICPKHAAAELVGSRAGHHLHLSGTAAHLGIDRGGDDAHFFDQIGTGVGGRECAMVVAPVGDHETVSCRVHRAQASAGKVALIGFARPRCRDNRTCAGLLQDQIHHIPAA